MQAHNALNLRNLRIFEGTFSLETAHLETDIKLLTKPDFVEF